MPARPGNARAFASASASSTRPAIRQPFCAPFSRRMRVSRRVSMSAIATTPCAAGTPASVCSRAPARRAQRQVADHQAGGVDPRRLLVLGVHAGVADVRVGQRDDLPAVGGIGEDLLVAGHGGVEHHLARRWRRRRRSTARERRCRRRARGGRATAWRTLIGCESGSDVKTGPARGPSRFDGADYTAVQRDARPALRFSSPRKRPGQRAARSNDTSRRALFSQTYDGAAQRRRPRRGPGTRTGPAAARARAPLVKEASASPAAAASAAASAGSRSRSRARSATWNRCSSSNSNGVGPGAATGIVGPPPARDLRRHVPEIDVADAHQSDLLLGHRQRLALVGQPVAHVVVVRDDAGARASARGSSAAASGSCRAAGRS